MAGQHPAEIGIEGHAWQVPFGAPVGQALHKHAQDIYLFDIYQTPNPYRASVTEYRLVVRRPQG